MFLTRLHIQPSYVRMFIAQDDPAAANVTLVQVRDAGG